MKKYLVVFVILLSITGCAKWKNKIAADGGLFGSYEGDYIIRELPRHKWRWLPAS